MSEHVCYIVKINKLNKHPNAHSLQIAEIFGCSVIVDMSVKIDDIGVFFPIDLQLSEEYCEYNNLIRKTDENGKNIGGYLEPNKRNIKAMRFRGEKSEGLYMPLESLKYTGINKFEVGEKFALLNGHEICRKYIPRGNRPAAAGKKGNKTRKKKVNIAPLFAEHADTEQLAYNLNAFQTGDLIEISLKMHGTSGRTGYLPKLKGYKRSLLDILLRREGKPIYEYGYVTGTRRVVLEDFEGGFYGSNAFREKHAKFFEGKLNKGETVYYEIVGFTTDGSPIMPTVNNNKISDKEFSKKYGKTTTFSYGCAPDGYILKRGEDYEGTFYLPVEVPQSDCYIYRMTMTNEDGDIIEYPPDFMRYRCEQMGAKYVPLLWRGLITSNDIKDFYIDEDGNPGDGAAGEYIQSVAEQFYDGPDPIGKIHVREGVVARIVNRPKFCAYKHKNFSFKVLSGIAADLAVESGALDTMDEDRLSEI